MSDQELGSPLEELRVKHRREKKELQAKIMNMKRGVAKDDKKGKKKLNSEIEELEREMKIRHEKELSEHAENESSTAADQAESQPKESVEKKEYRITKAQRRRDKKAADNLKFLKLAEQDKLNAQFSLGNLEMEQIKNNLDAKALALHEITPNGDCLFEAIAHQYFLVTGSDWTGKQMRSLAAEYMRKNREAFLPFMRNESGENQLSDAEFEKHCIKIERNCSEGGDWGGETELRALSLALEKNIAVFTSETTINYDCESSDQGDVMECSEFDGSLSLLERLASFIYEYVFRTVTNWLLLWITGRSEIERILLTKSKNDGKITMQIERLINSGEIPSIIGEWTEKDEEYLSEVVIDEYCYEKDMKLREHLKNKFQRSLRQIRGYRQLCCTEELLRKEKYDLADDVHEKKLLKLWEMLMPDEELEARKSNQWQKIGFQGNDPSTDFRGMGILSLDQLIFMAQYDVAHCQTILSLSNHPTYGFPMAITGITITALLHQLLQNGNLRQQFYNHVRDEPTIDSLHHIFCQLFKLFCSHWMRRKPDSLIYFNEVKQEFENTITEHLNSEQANIDELCESAFK